MASSLKNISSFLSPKLLSPVTPSRKFLANLPKSEGRLRVVHHQTKRSNVVKKLEFYENYNNFFHLSKITDTKNILPDIKIEKAPKHFEECVDISDFIAKSNRTLEINTPNKLELTKNGLTNFKSSTSVLGKGTFGTVFKGKHKGKMVAVKIVSNENSYREENGSNLIHPNVIRTLSIIRNLENQRYCLVVMEHLEDVKNLQYLLDTSENSLHEKKLLKKICIEITRGLDFCHKNGIMHLDLKPKNILVNSEYVCKICDFGNSRKVDDVDLDTFTHNGTIIYTAPEILFGRKPSKKSDIYSLGLIFWQIKYRENPFSNYDSNESIIYNVGKYNIRPPYKEENDALSKMFIKCWSREPELRPDTEEILRELELVNF